MQGRSESQRPWMPSWPSGYSQANLAKICSCCRRWMICISHAQGASICLFFGSQKSHQNAVSFFFSYDAVHVARHVGHVAAERAPWFMTPGVYLLAVSEKLPRRDLCAPQDKPHAASWVWSRWINCTNKLGSLGQVKWLSGWVAERLPEMPQDTRQ